MFERIQIAVEANKDELIKDRLALVRQNHGGKVTRLSDIFALAICLADYELVIDPEDVMATDDITILKDLLVSVQYFCEGVPLEVGKKLYVYHPGMEKIFLLKITEQGAEGYVHVHPTVVEDDEFELEHFSQTILDGVPQQCYHLRGVLVGHDQDDLAELIDSMDLGYLEEENYVLLLPFNKVSTKEDLITLGLMAHNGDPIRHDYK